MVSGNLVVINCKESNGDEGAKHKKDDSGASWGSSGLWSISNVSHAFRTSSPKSAFQLSHHKFPLRRLP
jgi:hypothetical protein